jgi:Phosphotransferase System HPr (HPr) Family
MKSFTYTIKEELGLHARPAGLVMKLAKNYSSSIILRTEKNKSADMKKLIALMGLCVKQGDTVTVTIEGEDEEAAWNEMNDFFLANL